MPLSRSFDLGHDSELRHLLAFTDPPQPGEITAFASGVYTVAIASAENAEISAVALNGFTYTIGNTVYVMMASNAPDTGIIVGRFGAATDLGVGTAPDGPLHAEDSAGGFAFVTAKDVAGTEITLLTGCIAVFVSGDILLENGATYNTAVLALARPGAGSNTQDVSLGASTVQFRCYANGDLRVIRTAGAPTIDIVIRLLYC